MTTSTITGTITGGVDLSNGNYANPVTVASGASITNTNYSYAVYANSSAAKNLVNDGTITENGYYAILFRAGGSVTNDAGGVIMADTGSVGVRLAGVGSDTFSNAGTVSGRYGVWLSGANNLIQNTGTITGSNAGAVVTGTNGTVENAGTIQSTQNQTAVYLYASSSNRLIIDPGAVFIGSKAAVAKNGAGTLELASGASAGMLSGMGTRYTGFQTLTIDSGATWDITGTIAGFANTTIHGFDTNDKLDLTNVTFSASDTTTFDSSSHILSILNGSGGTIGTVHFSGAYTGDFFHLTNDGSGGTFLTEDTTPCYCRGTRIRTPGGDVPVDALRIGDLVTTADGKALPIKWIGRRSYRDWLAVGNADVQPILFKAGSIADRVPARDLYVSPEHAMFIDNVLVPADHLVNGTSILKCEGMEEIEYFHLEFDRHVVIFAEDAPAESFVDDESRMLFHNADEYRRLYPDEQRPACAEFCAPRVEAGPALDALHRRLAARAADLRADGTAARQIHRGKVDQATGTRIKGWAFAGTDAGPVPLAILLNGAIVGRVVADGYRADLKAAGIGDGRHAFSFMLPKALPSGIEHRIEVRREADWSLLHGGPIRPGAR